MTLRHALAGTNCKVVELVPPAVQTALAGPGVAHGATLDDFCDAVFRELAAGKKVEVGFGPTKELRQEINGQDLKEIFAQSAKRFPVNTY
jgi:uncharacterized oxidoreductase